MPGRKGKTRTLTKIDPDILTPGARAFSQHGTSNVAARVTTTINPTLRPATLPEPIPFDVDPSNVVSESSGDEGNGEGVTREYYIARVRAFLFPGCVDSPQHQDDPLLLWTTAEQETFLDEEIRLEGRGIFTSPPDRCELCRKEGEYRCVDCFAVLFLCEGCMTRIHAFHPVHVIEVSLHIIRVVLYSPDIRRRNGTDPISRSHLFELLVRSSNLVTILRTRVRTPNLVPGRSLLSTPMGFIM
jgi:hypothetical protein